MGIVNKLLSGWVRVWGRAMVDGWRGCNNNYVNILPRMEMVHGGSVCHMYHVCLDKLNRFALEGISAY